MASFAETITEIIAADPAQAVDNVMDYMAEEDSPITRREAAILVERHKPARAVIGVNLAMANNPLNQPGLRLGDWPEGAK